FTVTSFAVTSFAVTSFTVMSFTVTSFAVMSFVVTSFTVTSVAVTSCAESSPANRVSVVTNERSASVVTSEARVVTSEASSLVFPDVVDHLPVVRQASRQLECDFAAQVAHGAQRLRDRRRERVAARALDLAVERHAVALLRVLIDDEAVFPDAGVPLRDFRDLRRLDEHAPHLRGLVGPSEPPPDAQVGAPAGARPGEHRRQVPGRETDQRILRSERGHEHFSDLAIGYRIAGAGPHDLDDHALVDDQTFQRRGFVRDESEVGACIALERRHSALAQPFPQAPRQRLR